MGVVILFLIGLVCTVCGLTTIVVSARLNTSPEKMVLRDIALWVAGGVSTAVGMAVTVSTALFLA